MVQRQVKYVTVVPALRATGLVAEVYAQVAEEMRLVVPPAMLHSPAPDVLAGYWALLREPLAADGVDRAAKEAAAAAVSIANICPYCADMHTVGMYDLSGEHDAEAVAADRIEEVADPRLRAVAAWARTAHQSDDRAPAPADLTAAQRAELVGVVVAFHYVARMVNVFLSNYLLPPGLSPRSRRRLKQGISRILRPTLREPRRAGRATALLPAAPAGTGPRWVDGQPEVARAFAAAYRVFDAAAERSVPPVVRRLVQDRLAEWRGEETGLSTQWCERLLVDLTPADAAAGRLALLTALASYRIDQEVVGEFRRHHPDDRTLVDLTAWASATAAAVVGERCAADWSAVPSDAGERKHAERRGTRPAAGIVD
ncbi:carboxymuconolactone decarboxylase family protein [Micromonospora sp. SH-82]|uniref:carboxymuconolactone decarboxylase family protein n=1 Tax=Micromonospora sp. SH-82 TaxID=3132938 RepID=UPI003EBF1F9B